MELKVLERFMNPVDAEIAKGVLEANGVACMITNSVIASVLPFELHLMVREEDYELAREILDNPNKE